MLSNRNLIYDLVCLNVNSDNPDWDVMYNLPIMIFLYNSNNRWTHSNKVKAYKIVVKKQNLAVFNEKF